MYIYIYICIYIYIYIITTLIIIIIHIIILITIMFITVTTITVMRAEALNFRPLGVMSVCGGCPACGLSAGSWRVESPFPLRHLFCLSAAQVHERGSEKIKISSRE